MIFICPVRMRRVETVLNRFFIRSGYPGGTATGSYIKFFKMTTEDDALFPFQFRTIDLAEIKKMYIVIIIFILPFVFDIQRYNTKIKEKRRNYRICAYILLILILITYYG